MKLFLQSALILVLTISAISCTSEKKNLPDDFDYGITGEGTYSNKFFKFHLEFNPQWVVQNKEQMTQLAEKGGDLAAGNDKNIRAAVKAAQVNMAYLLTVFKYEIGAPVDFNPSFMSLAENINKTPGIKNGKDYLFHVKKALSLSQINYEMEDEIIETEIGDETFYMLMCKMQTAGKTVFQEYYSTVTNGFSLSFIITYSTDEEREELNDILESINI